MKKETSSHSYLTISSYQKLVIYQHEKSLSPLTAHSQEIICQSYSNLDTIIQFTPIVTICYPLLRMLMSVASSSGYVLKYSVRSDNVIFVSLRAVSMDQLATVPTITLLLSANPNQHDNLSCVITVRAGFTVFQTRNYIQNPKTLLTTYLTMLLAVLYCLSYIHTSLSNLFSERPTTWDVTNMRRIRTLSRFAKRKHFLKSFLSVLKTIPNIPQSRLVFKMRYFQSAEAMASFALLDGSNVIHSFYGQIFKILENSKNN